MEHGIPVVSSAPGRGRQLNRAAAALDTEILLFLHADTTLPAGALGAVRAAVAGGAVGGGFRVRFDEQPPILDLGAALINGRTRWTGAPLGDQAQFVSRRAWERLGGFEDWPILEDLDLIRRLRVEGPVTVLPMEVTTSSRRFLQRGRRADRGDQLADLAALLPRRLAPPAGRPVSSHPLTLRLTGPPDFRTPGTGPGATLPVPGTPTDAEATKSPAIPGGRRGLFCLERQTFSGA